jgi:spore germination protein (amino acid permease)
MKSKIVFGSWEAITLMVNLVLARILMIFPRDMVKSGGSAGWIITILITLVAIIIFAIIAAMYKNIGNMDLVDISEAVGGRTLKVISGLLITIFLILTVSIFMGAFSQTLKITSLDQSPIEFVEMILFIGMLISGYYGIEAVTRINAFLVPILVIFFLLITLGAAPSFKVNDLFPVLGTGYRSLLTGSFLKLSSYASFIMLFLMVPYFKIENLKKIGYSYLIISGLLFLWSALSYILLFPYEIAIDKKIPVFQMARHIKFGYFIQRIESVFVLICSVCVLLFLCVIFTFTLSVFTKTFDLKKSKPMVLPIAIIILSLSLISRKINVELLGNSMVNLIWLFGIVFPLLIVIMGAVAKVGKKGKGAVRNGHKV